MNTSTTEVQTGTITAMALDEAGVLTPRTSWGAIWAGFFAALSVELVLTILMVGIFASFVRPAGGTPSGLSFGIGIAVWFFLQTLAAYYVGGWTTGKLARKPDATWNAVHSLAVWGITTALLIYLLVSALGSAFSGTLDLVRSGLGIAVNAHAAVAVATWIPIFIFITFACSLGTALWGGFESMPESGFDRRRMTRGTAP